MSIHGDQRGNVFVNSGHQNRKTMRLVRMMDQSISQSKSIYNEGFSGIYNEGIESEIPGGSETKYTFYHWPPFSRSLGQCTPGDLTKAKELRNLK